DEGLPARRRRSEIRPRRYSQSESWTIRPHHAMLLPTAIQGGRLAWAAIGERKSYWSSVPVRLGLPMSQIVLFLTPRCGQYREKCN
ncbi:MAG: hypothetical protein M3Y78_00955, partial [Pseudomonadota bacterium]|nr:hypothetical protein [Pseudomonadota bacterium]